MRTSYVHFIMYQQYHRCKLELEIRSVERGICLIFGLSFASLHVAAYYQQSKQLTIINSIECFCVVQKNSVD